MIVRGRSTVTSVFQRLGAPRPPSSRRQRFALERFQPAARVGGRARAAAAVEIDQPVAELHAKLARATVTTRWADRRRASKPGPP